MKWVLCLVPQFLTLSHFLTLTSNQSCYLVSIIILAVDIDVGFVMDELVGRLFDPPFELIAFTASINNSLTWR